jgi:hypothetical protein
MNLLFIPQNAARERLFMNQLMLGLAKVPGKTLLVHHTSTLDPEMNYYVTKKLSAGLGEQMIVNMPLAGWMRNLLVLNANGVLNVNTEAMVNLWAQLNVLVMSTAVLGPAGPVVLTPLQVLPALRNLLPIEHMVLFPNNPSSALVAQPQRVESEEHTVELRNLFPEEDTTIELARLLRPAVIASGLQVATLLVAAPPHSVRT